MRLCLSRPFTKYFSLTLAYFASFGENYRLYSQALIACGFVLARLVTVIVASVGSKKKKPSEKAE